MARDFVRSIEDSKDIKKEDINTTEENDIVSDPKASYINHRGTFKKITGGVEDVNIENLDKKITNNDDGTKDLNFIPNDEKIVDYLGNIFYYSHPIDVTPLKSGIYFEFRKGKGLRDDGKGYLEIDTNELKDILTTEILDNDFNISKNGKISILKGKKEKFVDEEKTELSLYKTKEEFKSITLLDTHYTKDSDGTIKLSFMYGIPKYTYLNKETEEVIPEVNIAMNLNPVYNLENYAPVCMVYTRNFAKEGINKLEFIFTLKKNIRETQIGMIIPNLVINYKRED